MPLKPNVLDDIGQENWVAMPPPKEQCFSDKDEALLEDESGRIKLIGAKVKSEYLMTGTVIGLLGYENKHGEFEVLDVCYPDYTNDITEPGIAVAINEIQ
jgi:DNA polymerase delta subunit 2